MPWKLSSRASRGKVQLPQSLFDAALQGADISGVIVIRRQRAQRRLPAHGRERAIGLIHHRGGRRSAILRIERCHQNAFAAIRLHCAEDIRDRRRAVTHRPAHIDLRAEPPRQLFGLTFGKMGQRRSFRHPHLAIGLRRFLGPRLQDDPAQDRLPQKRRDFDDPSVGQEFAQIALDRLWLGRLRRAEIDEQKADAGGGNRRVIGGFHIIFQN